MCDIAVQTSEFIITRYNGDGDDAGSSQLSVKVSNKVMTESFCGKTGTLSLVTSAVGALPVAGGPLSVVFGAVTAGCAASHL